MTTRKKKATGMVYCPKHRSYKGIYPPRVECEECWKRFAQIHGTRVANMYRNTT